MTIGNNFIFLYIPKTGSSFTIDVFKKINLQLKNFKYLLKRKKLITHTIKSPNIRDAFYNFKTDQHTTLSQVPEEKLINKEIVSVIRNPYHGYISRYEYKSYAKSQILKNDLYKNTITSNFPKFPDLTFNEYIDFSKFMTEYKLKNHLKIIPKVEMGGLSVQFIQMFAFNPSEVFEVVDFDFFKNGLKTKYFPEILFLNNEGLSIELYDFLIRKGYPKTLIDFIKDEEKKNVSVKKDYESYLDEKSINKIQKLEWFLFEYFSDRNQSWQ